MQKGDKYIVLKYESCILVFFEIKKNKSFINDLIFYFEKKHTPAETRAQYLFLK